MGLTSRRYVLLCGMATLLGLPLAGCQETKSPSVDLNNLASNQVVLKVDGMT